MKTIIFNAICVYLLSKYGFTLNNSIIYYVLVGLIEGTVIYISYLLDKNKALSVGSFAIFEYIAYMYLIPTNPEIILLRLIPLLFWLVVYLLWKDNKYIHGIGYHILWNLLPPIGAMITILLLIHYYYERD